MSTSYSNGERFTGWERERDLTGTWYGPFTGKNIAAAARSLSLFLLFCTRLQRGPAGLGTKMRLLEQYSTLGAYSISFDFCLGHLGNEGLQWVNKISFIQLPFLQPLGLGKIDINRK